MVCSVGPRKVALFSSLGDETELFGILSAALGIGDSPSPVLDILHFFPLLRRYNMHIYIYACIYRYIYIYIDIHTHIYRQVPEYPYSRYPHDVPMKWFFIDFPFSRWPQVGVSSSSWGYPKSWMVRAHLEMDDDLGVASWLGKCQLFFLLNRKKTQRFFWQKPWKYMRECDTT